MSDLLAQYEELFRLADKKLHGEKNAGLADMARKGVHRVGDMFVGKGERQARKALDELGVDRKVMRKAPGSGKELLDRMNRQYGELAGQGVQADTARALAQERAVRGMGASGKGGVGDQFQIVGDMRKQRMADSPEGARLRELEETARKQRMERAYQVQQAQRSKQRLAAAVQKQRGRKAPAGGTPDVPARAEPRQGLTTEETALAGLGVAGLGAGAGYHGGTHIQSQRNDSERNRAFGMGLATGIQQQQPRTPYGPYAGQGGGQR